MAMTRAEMLAEVRTHIDRETGEFSDASVNTRLEWAQQEVAARHTFKEMVTADTFATVDGTKSYAHPTSTKEILSLVVRDGTASRKLIAVPYREFDRVVPYPEARVEGKPQWYVNYAGYLELYPIPDDAYTVDRRYSFFPTAFSEDASESDLTNKDQLIIAIATRMSFVALRELEDASAWARGEEARLWADALQRDKADTDLAPALQPYRSGGEVSYPGGHLSPFNSFDV